MTPSDAVTRDELKSIIEIQSKNVEQLTVIANHLSTIVDRENKIYERLYNGLAKDISSAVNARLIKIEELMEDTRDRQAGQCAAASPLLKQELTGILANSTLSKDMGHIKWFISIVGVLVVVASVLIGGINRKEEAYNIVKQFKEQVIDVDYPMSDDLKEHMKTHG